MDAQSALKVLSPQEVAELLQVSDKTVSRLISNGQLVAIRIGRLRRITPESLKQFLRNQEKRERTSAVAQTGVKVVQ